MDREEKRTTKAVIIAATQKLFVESGYDNVGMRDIAAELSMSVGNLTYHFNKKEDLLEAVVADFCGRYAPRPPCKTLEELHDLLLFFEQLEEENLFYFSNYTQISRISEQVREVQRTVFLGNTTMWADTLNALHSAGLVQPEGFNGQFRNIGSTIHFMKVYWHERKEAEQHMGMQASRFSHAAWDILYPMLTEEGKEIYLRKIKKE